LGCGFTFSWKSESGEDRVTDETKTDEKEEATTEEPETTEEDDSALDDLIDSIEEVVEEKAHWLFGKLFGRNG
jgi:hypothetical protein